jgi:hypothetical protein
VRCPNLVSHREQPPIPGDALERTCPEIVELDSRTRHQISYRARDDYLAAPDSPATRAPMLGLDAKQQPGLAGTAAFAWTRERRFCLKR